MRILSSLLLILLLSITPVLATDYCGDTDCQGCWIMDTDEEPITDDSQNTNTAAYVVTPAYATADPPDAGDGADWGQTGYYTLASGDGFTVTDSDSSLDCAGTDCSIVMWAFLTVGVNDTAFMVQKYKSSYARNGYRAGKYVYSSTPGMYVCNSHSCDEQRGGSLAVSEWEHIGVTLDSGSTMYQYSNGSETSDSSGGTIGATTEALLIGGIGTVEGSFCQVAVFDRLLSSVEVSDLMANGLSAAAAPAGRTRRFF